METKVNEEEVKGRAGASAVSADESSEPFLVEATGASYGRVYYFLRCTQYTNQARQITYLVPPEKDSIFSLLPPASDAWIQLLEAQGLKQKPSVVIEEGEQPQQAVVASSSPSPAGLVSAVTQVGIFGSSRPPSILGASADCLNK